MADLNFHGLVNTPPDQTYLDGYAEVWIGSKWDIAHDDEGRFAVYRKGNYVLTVGTLELALALVGDDERSG